MLTVSFGGYTVHVSAVGLALTCISILAIAVVGLIFSRGRHVVIRQSPVTSLLAAQLERIGEALEQLNRSNQEILRARPFIEPSSLPSRALEDDRARMSTSEHRVSYSMFGR